MQAEELLLEREYTKKVQARLLSLIAQADALSGEHTQSISAILADAWEELRLRPTSISPMELEQLAMDVDRYTARKAFAENLAKRAKDVLGKPFFGRVDFREDGETDARRVTIGLTGVSDENSDILVYDWRAPICSLYYDGETGAAVYDSPDGPVTGEMTLKRRYHMENGTLEYYADESGTIADDCLLEILSKNAEGQMHEIAATIQSEQNAAIRAREAKVMAVVGAAGSGKSGVALHRAAFLLYRRQGALRAEHMAILSPNTAFSEYISGVLPELGEENIAGFTLHTLVEKILDAKVEHPARAQQRLLTDDAALRTLSVSYKCTPEFVRALDAAILAARAQTLITDDLILEGKTVFAEAELRRMADGLPASLTPHEKRMRMRAQLEKRLESIEEKLSESYRAGYARRFPEKQAKNMAVMAAAARLRPLRAEMDARYAPRGENVLGALLEKAPEALRTAYEENRKAGYIWWEDAVALAYIKVRLGAAAPDKRMQHLLVDEAQDYSNTALKLIAAYYPRACVTLLGDPMQRTTPGMPDCTPETWSACFGVKDMPLQRLTKTYRTTAEIAALCSRLLPNGARLESVDRHGDVPNVARMRRERLDAALSAYRAKGGTIAVITRDSNDARSIASRLKDVYRLDGGKADARYEVTDNIVAGYHQTKGLEFDSVIVVWPDGAADEGEKRRLYTACSRAMHSLTVLFTGEKGALRALLTEEQP